MTERLMAKLERLGAEAGIKEMTPEIYRFSSLVREDVVKGWEDWRQRAWDDGFKEGHEAGREEKNT